MVTFKFYVIIGIIIAVTGGILGAAGAFAGNVVGSIVFLYAFPALAIIIILWGFATVVDRINDNTERIAEIMEYFTQTIEAIGTESPPEGAEEDEKQADVSYE
jgi:mannose/fructose/N-acetylgalactosamine-specific phosphotransferase system component IID